MLIGKIVEVRGIKILAKMDKKLPPHIIENGNIIPAPQINSYVKTRVGLDIIVCQNKFIFSEEGGTRRYELCNNKK